jgi:chemotaxis protein CheC
MIVPTPEQMDALKEMVNIGVGHAASVLNAMLRSHIVLHLPMVEVLQISELRDKIQRLSQGTFSTVRIGFKGPFTGSASLIFPAKSAARLVDLITEGDSVAPDLDAIRIGTLTEVGNIVLNSVMGSIGNELQQRMFYSVPIYLEDPLSVLLKDQSADETATLIWIQTRFASQDQQIEGEIVILFGTGSMELLMTAVDNAIGMAG